jgi:hypothetical protein
MGPNNDQTYSGGDITLPGTAESFNKTGGKSFTMNAPSQLTLQIADNLGQL